MDLKRTHFLQELHPVFLLALGCVALAACGPQQNAPSSQDNQDIEISENSVHADSVHADSEKLAARLQSEAKLRPPSSESLTVIEQKAGRLLAEAHFNGMVDLGTQDGWSLYFDKESNQLVATDWKQTLAFSPKGLQDGTVLPSLESSGIPIHVLMSWKGVLCRAACWGAAAAGCAAVSVVCAAGTTFTFGGFAIPCGWAIVAACAASGAGASVCSDRCSAKYG